MRTRRLLCIPIYRECPDEQQQPAPCVGIVPTITSIAPDPARALSFLTITGTHLDIVQVFISGVLAQIYASTPTQLVVIVPSLAVSGAVTVVTDASHCGGGSASFPLIVEGTTATLSPACLIGTAASYGVLTATGLSGGAVVTGGSNIGLGTGTATGAYTPAVDTSVASSIALSDLAAGVALLQLRTYATPGTVPSTPGHYRFTTVTLAGTTTLTGTATDFTVVWVTGVLTIAAGAVVETNGIPNCNVVFLANQIVVGAGVRLSGIYISQTTLTVGAACVTSGRLLAQVGPAALNATAVQGAPCACGGPLSCIPPPIYLVFQCDVSGSISPYIRDYQGMFSAALTVLQSIQTTYATPVFVSFMTFASETVILGGSASFMVPTYLNVVTDAAAITAIINGFKAAGYTNWSAATQALQLVSNAAVQRPDLLFFITDGEPTIRQISLSTAAWQGTTASDVGSATIAPSATCMAQVATIMSTWTGVTPQMQVLGLGTSVNVTNLNTYAAQYPGTSTVSVQPDWTQVSNTLVEIINALC